MTKDRQLKHDSKTEQDLNSMIFIESVKGGEAESHTDITGTSRLLFFTRMLSTEPNITNTKLIVNNYITPLARHSRGITLTS